MPPPDALRPDDLSPDELIQLQRWCDRYEEAWYQHAGHVSLAEWIDKAPAKLRAPLFPELLDLDGRLRRSESEYLSQLTLSRICPWDVAVAAPERSGASADPGPEDQTTVSSARRPAGVTSDLTITACDTFRGLGREAAGALEASIDRCEFAAGETLLRQDEPAAGLFLIQAGQLTVEKRDGKESRVMDRCGAGSILGEMSLLTGQTCTATVVASRPVRARRLSVEAFERLRTAHPEIEIALSQLVSDRLGSRQADALCGRTMGGYRLHRCIARGGMGVLYEASAVDRPEPHVAVKMLRHRFVHDAEVVEHFQREASVLRGLRHENVLPVYDSFVDYRTRFLVLRLCQGYDLRRLVARQGPLPRDTVQAILGQIVAGLQAVHDYGIVHLDLKPENVLIEPSGQVAIADFGLCQILGQDSAKEFIQGTPAYMPPEQLSGHSVDRRGDWYATGCLVYELLTGRRLFRSSDLMSLLAEKMTFDPSSLEQIGDADERLRAWIRQTLQPDPSRRRWDAEQWLALARPIPIVP